MFEESILKRARERNLVSIATHDIRAFSENKHRKVDDYPYGGEAGMLMRPEPVCRAVEYCKAEREGYNPTVVFLTPRGEPFSHTVAYELAETDGLVLLCGHYKGIDERAVSTCVDREISLGDFVLSGGEIGAMAIVDAVSRLLPGVLGNSQSASLDSHYDGLLSAPAYTRPEEYKGLRVPEILLSGHHKKIAEWKQHVSQELTKKRRPDLWDAYRQKMENGGL